ncbi:MAG: hypothetical protein LBE99_00970 [Puniceicoccales bacterium]|nr:hypothetical protein [Puniceicoccales bacterium]
MQKLKYPCKFVNGLNTCNRLKFFASIRKRHVLKVMVETVVMDVEEFKESTLG